MVRVKHRILILTPRKAGGGSTPKSDPWALRRNVVKLVTAGYGKMGASSLTTMRAKMVEPGVLTLRVDREMAAAVKSCLQADDEWNVVHVAGSQRLATKKLVKMGVKSVKVEDEDDDEDA